MYSLLAMTLGPGLIILGWIYLKDTHEKEPLYLLFLAFFGGAISTGFVIYANILWQNAGFGISDTELLPTAFYAFISVGGTEELAKLLVVLLFFYNRKAFNEPFDGIVYCVAVSMGFATAENFLYVYGDLGPGDPRWIALLRMFSAVPAHATFAILMGFFVGHSKFGKNKIGYLMMAFIVAAFTHGAYDFFLFIRNIPGISIGAFISLFLGIRYARKAIRYNQEVSPFRNQ